jgi:hypothetical protein
MHGTSLHHNNTAYVVDEVHLHHQHAEARSTILQKLCIRRGLSLSVCLSLGVSHGTDTQNSQILLPVNTRVAALKIIATLCVCVCVCVCMSPLLSDEPRIRSTYMALRERSRGMKEVLQKVEESYLPDMLHRQRADMKKRHMYGRQRAKEMRCVCVRERGREIKVSFVLLCVGR